MVGEELEFGEAKKARAEALRFGEKISQTSGIAMDEEDTTVDQGLKTEEKVIMINNVAKVFFEDSMKRTVCVAKVFFEDSMNHTVCVELPTEDGTGEYEKGQAVGLLELSLYGMRDA